jgi:hypothetical protein
MTNDMLYLRDKSKSKYEEVTIEADVKNAKNWKIKSK